MALLPHFGLDAQPFDITPDPSFLYQSRAHRAAETVFEFGVVQSAPIVILTGEVGVGKTTLIRKFLNADHDDLVVGLISNFTSRERDLYSWILNAFDQPVPTNQADQYSAIVDFLHREHDKNHKVLLLIDEAQAISDSDLEQLRLLTNISDGKSILLMVALVGQPELRDRISQADNKRIRQCVALHSHIGPMSAQVTAQYVRHRLRIAGAEDDIFDDEAIAIVHELAGGIPRVTNIICNLAMYYAFGEGMNRIDGAAMRQFLQDTEQNGYLAHLPNLAKRQAKIIAFPPRPVTSERPKAVADAPAPAEEQTTTAAHARPQNDAPDPSPVPAEPDPASSPEPEALVQTVKIAPTPDAVGNRPERKTRKAPWALAAAASAAATVYMVAGSPQSPAPSQMAALPLPALQAAQTPTEGTAPTNIAKAVPPSVADTPPAPLPDPGGPALMAQGLELGVSDPQEAATAYARAALRGEARAAAYLGQMYETGDGVPLNPELARAWYGFSDTPTRSARRRLEAMGTPASDAALVAPLPLLGGPLAAPNGPAAEFIWTSASTGADVLYHVELAQSPNAPRARVSSTTASAILLETGQLPKAARVWRVVASDASTGRLLASDWAPLGAR